MNAQDAVDTLQRAFDAPLQTWLDYTPKDIPLVVFDQEEFLFVNPPNLSAPLLDRQPTGAACFGTPENMTATLLLANCEDEPALILRAYHECFHVYQARAFQPNPAIDFCDVLAFYPEFVPSYRTLCQAESEVISDPSLSPGIKAQHLASLAGERHAILSQRPGLLEYERALERSEGTAAFVGQKARAILFNLAPENAACFYGYGRQYSMGAAVCWLLEEALPNGGWQAAVQKGASPTETLCHFFKHKLPTWGLWNAPKRR